MEKKDPWNLPANHSIQIHEFPVQWEDSVSKTEAEGWQEGSRGKDICYQA